MKRWGVRVLLLWLLVVAGSSQVAKASQVYGHLYFADIMVQSPGGCYLDLQDETRAEFFLGSLAPDSAWLAHMISSPQINGRLYNQYGIRLPKHLRPVSSQLDDVHQVRPTKVALQLLVLADKSTDRAFALGWLSHYIVDSHIHDLINRHGGYVVDPSIFDDPAMKLHDRLEALEMRHVLELRGARLRDIAFQTHRAQPPGAFLRLALGKVYPQNAFYERHPEYFLRTFALASDLMLDSTRWYGYQSEHSEAKIARMKRLIRRFRPKAGKVLSVLTDLPPLPEYKKNLVKGPFIADWNRYAAEVAESSRYLMAQGAAYYWWRDRNSELGDRLSAEALDRVAAELHRINPQNDLMQPRSLRRVTALTKQ